MIRKFGRKQIEISPCGQSGCEDVGCVIFWRERHTHGGGREGGEESHLRGAGVSW